MMSEERSTSDLNVNVIQQSYMANTVLPVINNDIETGSNRSNSSNSSNSSNEKSVLKGILKKSHNQDDETRTGLLVIKLQQTHYMVKLVLGHHQYI